MDADVLWNASPVACDQQDEYDSEEERKQQEELEADLYSKLHYAEHSELQDPAAESDAASLCDKKDTVPPAQVQAGDIQRDILEAKMNSPERDSGKSSLKSEALSEGVVSSNGGSPTTTSKYDDDDKKVIDVGDSSDSESDDGIQIVEHVAKPKKEVKKEPVVSSCDFTKLK